MSLPGCYVFAKGEIKCNIIIEQIIYEKLHQERRKLIEPIRETDEQYILNWQNSQINDKSISKIKIPRKLCKKMLTSVLGNDIVQICQVNLAENEKYTLQ